MLIKILAALSALVLILVVVVATRPATFRIERSLSIAAPAETIFNQLNDFHAWAAWSPWDKLDPKMERIYSGAPVGEGAIYAWKSKDSKVGEGRMTLEKSTVPSHLQITVEFIAPFAATNQITFTLTPDTGGTRVTWAMDGNNGFMSKAFSMVVNMDKLVGGDFERGLATLKQVAESRS